MSLESAISDLINSTNTLNANVQSTLSTVNTNINSLKDNFLPANATLYVGPGKQFTTIQSAIDYANTRFPLNFGVNIKLSDGVYTITSNISGSNKLKGLTITGNILNPENCIIDGTGLGSGSSIFYISSGNLTIAGVKLIGDNTKGIKGITAMGCNLSISDGVIISNVTVGIELLYNAYCNVSTAFKKPNNLMDLIFDNVTSYCFYCYSNSWYLFQYGCNITVTNSTFNAVIYSVNCKVFFPFSTSSLTFTNSVANYFINCSNSNYNLLSTTFTNTAFKVSFINAVSNSSVIISCNDSTIDMQNTTGSGVYSGNFSRISISSVKITNANTGLKAESCSTITATSLVTFPSGVTTISSPVLNTVGNGNSFILG